MKWEERAKIARKHAADFERRYSTDIALSARDAKIYTAPLGEGNVDQYTGINYGAESILVAADSVDAAFRYSTYCQDCVILNFASYKEPGGLFLRGSFAQEEALCHESGLYNVLSKRMDYYRENRKMGMNMNLYNNRALYSFLVPFEHNGQLRKLDVLTCAAPNFSSASKYDGVTKEENSFVLRDRIRFVLSIINDQSPDIAILGAFGCGVFGQDATEVATIFREEIAAKKWQKKTKLVFAIPRGDKYRNYAKFRAVANKNR